MFMYSEHDRSTFTDPELVEHLVDWLRARGFTNLTVVEAQSAYGNYFFDRGVLHVAEVVGYQPRERYRIVDLTEEMVPHHFDGPVGDHFVGPTWRDADFRISFAKNKTHTWAWYTLCLKTFTARCHCRTRFTNTSTSARSTIRRSTCWWRSRCTSASWTRSSAPMGRSGSSPTRIPTRPAP